MGSLRTPEQWTAYERYRAEGGLDGCRLCDEEETLKGFKHWRILRNKFPYDRIAETHHMIVPRRHVAGEGELSKEETAEYANIKHGYLQENYEFILEGTHKKKSIPEHFHLHLINVRD